MLGSANTTNANKNNAATGARLKPNDQKTKAEEEKEEGEVSETSEERVAEDEEGEVRGWQVGDLLAQWWRPNFEGQQPIAVQFEKVRCFDSRLTLMCSACAGFMYPYVPGSVPVARALRAGGERADRSTERRAQTHLDAQGGPEHVPRPDAQEKCVPLPSPPSLA